MYYHCFFLFEKNMGTVDRFARFIVEQNVRLKAIGYLKCYRRFVTRFIHHNRDVIIARLQGFHQNVLLLFCKAERNAYHLCFIGHKRRQCMVIVQPRAHTDERGTLNHLAFTGLLPDGNHLVTVQANRLARRLMNGR